MQSIAQTDHETPATEDDELQQTPAPLLPTDDDTKSETQVTTTIRNDSASLSPSPSQSQPRTDVSVTNVTDTAPPHSTTNPFPTRLSDIHLPTHTPSLYRTLTHLHHSTLSPLPRLRSIHTDSLFVSRLSTHTCLPLLANERCGSWYIPPLLKSGSAYFKSTDGHYGQWDFSLRRLNLQVLEMLGREGGAVLVDSTRRGKEWSDALRRTVPVWCAVWGNVLFAGEGGDGMGREGLQTPEGGEGVGASERSQVEGRMMGWEEDLRGLGLDLEGLRGRVKRRVKCVWASNGTWDWEGDWEEKRKKWGDVNVLVLASASRRVRGAEMSEGGYVQGAGDDSEGWARGLTSQLWWENWEELLVAGEGEVEGMIDRIVKDAKEKRQEGGECTRVEKAKNLFVGAGRVDEGEDFDLVISCQGAGGNTKSVLNLNCREGKLGSKDLREKLSSVRDVARAVLRRDPDSRILVTCSTGKDLSIGTALSLICLFYSASGELNASGTPAFINKMAIKQRLAWITTCTSDANPSRATLQAVNSFLIDRPS